MIHSETAKNKSHTHDDAISQQKPASILRTGRFAQAPRTWRSIFRCSSPTNTLRAPTSTHDRHVSFSAAASRIRMIPSRANQVAFPSLEHAIRSHIRDLCHLTAAQLAQKARKHEPLRHYLTHFAKSIKNELYDDLAAFFQQRTTSGQAPREFAIEANILYQLKIKTAQLWQSYQLKESARGVQVNNKKDFVRHHKSLDQAARLLIDNLAHSLPHFANVLTNATRHDFFYKERACKISAYNRRARTANIQQTTDQPSYVKSWIEAARALIGI